MSLDARRRHGASAADDVCRDEHLIAISISMVTAGRAGLLKQEVTAFTDAALEASFVHHLGQFIRAPLSVQSRAPLVIV